MTRSLEIDMALWASSDALRGVVEPHTFGKCALAILFLKYVSDVASDQPRSTPQRFVLPACADFQSLLENRRLPGNGARIDAALSELQRANPEKFGGLFADVRFSPRSIADVHAQDNVLAKVLEIIGSDTLDLRPSRVEERDVVGAFTFLVNTLAFESHSDAGELYTPSEVSSLMAQLVDPRPGDSLYDPVCGSSSLLLTCARLIQERHNSREYEICGQDINYTAWMLSKINAFLHGEDRHRIVCGDTLRNPLLLGKDGGLERFDVIVANPPFSLSEWGWEQAAGDSFGRFRRGIPPRSRADYAFILHMIESMNPDTGRMAVVASHGVLFRGAAEADIRKNLIESNLLDAVIGLPPKLFHNTAIPTVILCFRAKRSDDDSVLFIDASRDFAPARKRNELRESDIQRVITAWQRRAGFPGYATIVTRSQIAANDFNLSIPLYISAAAEPRIDLDTLARKQRELDTELTAIRREIESRLQQLTRAT